MPEMLIIAAFVLSGSCGGQSTFAASFFFCCHVRRGPLAFVALLGGQADEGKVLLFEGNLVNLATRPVHQTATAETRFNDVASFGCGPETAP